MHQISYTYSDTVGRVKRPLTYPKGTRTTSVHFTLSGEPVDYNIIVGLAIAEWLKAHTNRHSEFNVPPFAMAFEGARKQLDQAVGVTGNDPDDFFITIGFSTVDVIVEVSDRMKER